MARTDAFVEDRFGMFIHWGLYSVPAGIWQGRKIQHPYAEWLQASEKIPRSIYRQLTEQFNPTSFVADDWVREAKNAGMRYMVITAKHHDGFALWPSRVSRYNVMDETPFHRDILAELKEACNKHQMKLGFYYSHWQDWEGCGGDICSVHMENEEYQHPTQEAFAHYWSHKCLPQVQELLREYDPFMLWFDTWSEDSLSWITPERQDELIALIRREKPDCLINSRIQFLAPSSQVDFISTMDNHFPDNGFDKPWETSGTLNRSWAYHALDFQWKSTRELLQNLVRNVSLGGNYQLNVGPRGDGAFQPAAIRRLREMGAWLLANGKSVYGCGGSRLGNVPWGVITANKKDTNSDFFYLHLWDFSIEEPLTIPHWSIPIVKARVLETGQKMELRQKHDEIQIILPETLRCLDLPVIELECKKHDI